MGGAFKRFITLLCRTIASSKVTVSHSLVFLQNVEEAWFLCIVRVIELHSVSPGFFHYLHFLLEKHLKLR